MNLSKCGEWVKRHAIPLIVTAICVYALYLRLMWLSKHDLWLDEYYQLNQMKGSFLDMIRSLPENEFCAYLSGDYYLIYPFFKMFGFNKWGLAIPHIISTVLGFYLLYLVCQRYFKSLWGYVITFGIVCFNATMLEHATEVRIYALLPTLSLACLYFWHKLIDSNYAVSRAWKIAAGTVFVLTMWSHVYGIMIFGFTGLFALVVQWTNKEFWSMFRRTFVFGCIALGIALPLWLVSVFGPTLERSHFSLNVFEYIPNPKENPVGFLKGVFGNLMGDSRGYFLLAGVFAPFLLPYQDRFRQIAMLFLLVFIPIGVVLMGNILAPYWFMQRLFIWTMPFFALFIGWAWESSILYFKTRFSK